MTYSKLANRAATRSVLEDHGLEAKYQLGQNFLVDDGIVGDICELADLRPDDAVLEVGPGIGTLTCALLPRCAALVAVEADRDMQGPLAFTTADYSERFALVLDDATRVQPSALEGALAGLYSRGAAYRDLSASGAKPLRKLPNRWVSNLPYAVAATLVLRYFEQWDFIEDAVVMVQSEVADRICADPGGKIYGAYTVKLRLYARVVGRVQVPARSFYPAPHVESAVVRLERLPESERLAPEEAREVASVVDAAFAQRRKTIRNSMSAAKRWTKERLDAAFGACGIDPAARAETFGLPAFVALTRALRDRGGR